MLSIRVWVGERGMGWVTTVSRHKQLRVCSVVDRNRTVALDHSMRTDVVVGSGTTCHLINAPQRLCYKLFMA